MRGKGAEYMQDFGSFLSRDEDGDVDPKRCKSGLTGE